MAIRDALTFFKRFLGAPAQVGSIIPSSRALARRMASYVPAEGTVLEIGAGTGPLTGELIARLTSPEQLTSVEMDAELGKIFRKRFPQIRLIEDDAETILNDESRWDAIISSIPFTNMEARKRNRMLKLISRALKPGCALIALQYSHILKSELESIFKNITVLYVPLNIPPAIVYVCREPRS